LKEPRPSDNMGDSLLGHRRVPSAGTRDFKINTSSISPNSSELRYKKSPSSQANPANITASIYSQGRKNNYFESSKTQLGNNSVGAISFQKRAVGHLIGGKTSALPLSSIEKKMRDMLTTSFTEKPSLSNKRMKQQQSDLSDKAKNTPLGHKKTDSAKSDIISKYVMKNRPKGTDKQNVIDLSNKDHFNPPASREKNPSSKLEAKDIIEKTLGRNHLNESILRRYHESIESSKEALKSNSLYQKFSKKIASSKGHESGATQEMLDAGTAFKKEKSKTIPLVDIDPEDNTSLYLKKKGDQGSNAPKRAELGIHKRAESENLKKLKLTDPADPKTSNEKGHSTIKRPNSQSNKLSAVGHSVLSHTASIIAKKENHSKSRSNNSSALIPKKRSSVLESIRRAEHLLPQFEGSKVIIKEFGCIKSFAVNTHQGTIRSYNEDRVSILLNAQQRFDRITQIRKSRSERHHELQSVRGVRRPRRGRLLQLPEREAALLPAHELRPAELSLDLAEELHRSR
jgi:hypothetical protein